MSSVGASTHARPSSESHCDTGVDALVTLLAFFEINSDASQIIREFWAGRTVPLSSLDLVRAARERGLKARLTMSAITRLDRLPLPAIAANKNGTFFILAKAANGRALIKDSV